MKVVPETVNVNGEFRAAVARLNGQAGMASHSDVKRWLRAVTVVAMRDTLAGCRTRPTDTVDA